ncbi:MAG: T9SS type A sorting domain-containing protein [Bacteroidota bacterium]|nr:T9SS type A sorting domain-containing protein [Bacteroidota bacterium]MDP4233138.1 T9SS type A sorting domain-containing protein [Bacteroidota bacterium]MDP4241717.1 T9SS type A sorting domain-containing protein [Bacteroidota bacterium]MDP4287375.1 T9SS type A sorting domain-containing protein [Bacteroidota bacterium]
MKRLLALVLILAATQASAQFVKQKLIVPPRFLPLYDSSRTIMLPAEYQIQVFYAGSPFVRPRFMAMGPNNTIYIADLTPGRIYAIEDTNRDGVADTARLASMVVDSAHSLAFHDNALYVAIPDGVRKFRDTDHDGFYETEDPFISGIGATGVYNHFTRTVLFDTLSRCVYLGVGASCNACRESDTERAAILRFNLDGSGKSIYASGLRNPLGLAINPVNSKLWCANADRDGLSDSTPPEIITSVTPSGFYGWPFAYGTGQWDNFQARPEYTAMLPITASDSARVASMTVGDLQLVAHCTPMAIMFYRDPRIYIKPPPQTALVAIHGSSPGGRSIAVGYKVIQLTFDDAGRLDSTSDFLTGFLTDSINYKFWGRPCGLVQDSAGDIYLSSDLGIPAIYRICLRNSSSVGSPKPLPASISVYPNPASDLISVSLPSNLVDAHSRLQLLDALGRTIRQIQFDRSPISIDVHDIANGQCFLRVVGGESSITCPIVIAK